MGNSRMHSFARSIGAASLLALLASCGLPTHPINPPNASIQQLDILPDGRWKLHVRLENFSDKTVHYKSLKATLKMGSFVVTELALKPELDIPGENADVVETVISIDADTQRQFRRDVASPGGAAYELKGTINIPAAEKDFKFEHKSHLSPVPGIADQFR